MNRLKLTSAFVTLLVILFLLGPCPGCGQDTEKERAETAVRVLKDMLDKAEGGVPPTLLHKAQGLAIIPKVIRAAYGLGGQYGRGLVMIRQESGEWSNPCFIQLAGGSLGWQIGVQEADVLLVFKSRTSVEDITQGKVTLGADARVTAGPAGRSAEANTDLEFKEEIYSYSQSRGLFAGVSLQGVSLMIDNKANGVFYGQPAISAREILIKGRGQAPAVVQELKRLLSSI